MAGTSAWSRDPDVKDGGLRSRRGFTNDKVTIGPQQFDDVFKAFNELIPRQCHYLSAGDDRAPRRLRK